VEAGIVACRSGRLKSSRSNIVCSYMDKSDRERELDAEARAATHLRLSRLNFSAVVLSPSVPVAVQAEKRRAALGVKASALSWLSVGSVSAAELLLAELLEPDVSWDFEAGLRGWVKTGDAFDSQPTYGDNVVLSRLGLSYPLGGDYWDVPTSVGQQGSYWIGTYEDRPSADVPGGTVQGDGHTGTLTSAPFLLRHSVIDFLVGGGADEGSERIELVVAGADYEALLEGRPPAGRDIVRRYRSSSGSGAGGSLVPAEPGVPPPDAQRDALGVSVRRTSGDNSEYLRRRRWDVGAFLGSRCWIRIIDQSTGPWGHINVDDIRFQD
jgi:hypothetical protein